MIEHVLPIQGFRRLLAIVTFFTCVFQSARADEPRVQDAPRVFQSSGAVLLDVRRRAANDASLAGAIDVLRADADAALNAGPFAIVHKKHPLPGIDPHEYVSLARYY